MGARYNHQIDEPFCEEVAADLAPLLLGATTELIKHHAERDLDRTVSSALQEFLKTLEQQEANDDLEEELDRMDEDGNEKLESLMTQIAEKATAKQVQKLKNILRKNYSAGTKARTQSPRTMVEANQDSAEINPSRSRDKPP